MNTIIIIFVILALIFIFAKVAMWKAPKKVITDQDALFRHKLFRFLLQVDLPTFLYWKVNVLEKNTLTPVMDKDLNGLFIPDEYVLTIDVNNLKELVMEAQSSRIDEIINASLNKIKKSEIIKIIAEDFLIENTKATAYFNLFIKTNGLMWVLKSRSYEKI
jgi:hypothetical protein